KTTDELYKDKYSYNEKAFGIEIGTWAYRYNWHDYQTFNVISIDKDGNVNTVSTENKVGKLRTNTNFDWGEGYANTKLKTADLFKPTKEKSQDGYMFTTKNWVGEGNYRYDIYLSTDSGPSVNIDDILGAFKAAGRTGNITKGTSIDQALSYLNGLAQEVYDKTPSPQEKKESHN